ncbi:NAD(P)/FAD-dependent oxidoreductase [Sulfuriroseicoccus oceanibius]|uniref:FAD-dependent monooxygenase n=1 Tax=Sulfuriroseicoccus oceanibius TaxID=2707525 RepID=A0A6B3LC03_9BACT|nr:FAD-dependent monooxygenase [Sulfuriroseicoccus oceanibius]QQL45919.1 FAD-dependent monooxygenase [Sulfuriroseicoccus oceanibius]
MKDVRIVGGGLAGLSLGIALRERGVPVRVLEAGRYPQHRVCGEFICGVSDDVLDSLGVIDLLSDAVEHSRMAWWVGDELVMTRPMPQSARGISRYVLDQRLADRFCEFGGDLMVGRRGTEERSEGVVWAAGKRKAGGRTWIGLKVHIDLASVDGLEMHVGERGYLGLCRVAGDRVNACGLFRMDQGLKGRGGDLLLRYLEANGLGSLARRLAEGEMDATSFSATAGFSLGSQPSGGQVCIGDRLNLIPPFTGNGMSMALESSALLMPLLVRYSKGELTWDAVARKYAEAGRGQFSRRMTTAKVLHPMLFHPLGRGVLSRLARGGVLPLDYLFNRLRTP